MQISTFKKIRVTILLFLIITSSSSYSQWKFADSTNISQENYEANFKQIHDIVSQNYTHLKSKKINLDSLFLKVQQNITESKNKEEYFGHLLYYFSELKNSHSRLLLRGYGINCSAKLIENRLLIEKVNDDKFIENGIHHGDEIVQIDNVKTADWLELQRHYVSSSTSEGELNAVVLFQVFSDIFKGFREYSIKTSNGIRQIKVDLVNPADYSYLLFKNEPKASGKILNEKTAYIEIKSMTGNVVQDFVKVYNELGNYPNLILDLRRNSGGNSSHGEQMARYLVNKRQKACVSRKHIKPYSNNYKGSIYVLTDVFTGSAAESFVLDLRESGTTVLVGSLTNGDTGNLPKTFTTEFGLTFSIPTLKKAQVSFKGFPMEGIGIPPHHKVKQTIEDYNNKIDTVLEYTLNLIKP